MAQIIEASETPELHTVCTVQAEWGEFIIDADKAAEAVAEFLSHYYRSRMGGYALSDGWMQEAVQVFGKCVIDSVENTRNNAGMRV